MSKTRSSFLARFPQIKATHFVKGESKDCTEQFLTYLIEDNVASGDTEAEKQEIANAIANKIGVADIQSYAEYFGCTVTV
jgi:hypothetical protein